MATINKIFCATDRDGGSDGNMDSIAYLFLNDNDMCMVVEASSNTCFFYRYESSNNNTSNPDDGERVVVPDDNLTGTGAWLLQSGTFEDITILDDIIQVADDMTVVGTLEVQGNIQVGDADGTGGNQEWYSDTEGDFMKFDKTAKTFTLTDIALTAPTIDATTDFTIGDTVITDGVVTDSTGLQLAADVDITGALTFDAAGAAVTAFSGADVTAITGTAGTNGDFAIWNADGDIVDGPTPSDYVTHALATAENDFLVASGSGAYVKKTLAETGAILEADLDHGSIQGLADDDHTQYTLHAIADAENDFMVASGANTFVKKTLAETGAILEADLDHGSIQGLSDDDHTQYVLHSIADTASDFLVASGNDAFVKKTLAETGAILEADIDHGNIQGLDTGADHSYIDQDVTTTGTPTFAKATVDSVVLDARNITFSGAGQALIDCANGQNIAVEGVTFDDGAMVATTIGAFQAVGSIDFNSQDMTNVDIDSGTIDGTPIAGSTGSFTTCDASTDFTVGDTIITDGVITDATGLDVAASVTMNDLTLDNCGKLNTGSTPAGVDPMEYNGYFYATRVYNPVYADIAEMWRIDMRSPLQKYAPGSVVAMGDNGLIRPVKQTGEEPTIGIITDTYGYCLGNNYDHEQRPIAIAGKVLAFVDKIYTPGTPLWASGQKQGMLTQMSKRDRKSFPERVIGKYLYKEPKKNWGPIDNKTKVNDRHWVKVV